MRFIGNDTERPIIEVLESYTPKIYENSKVVSEIMRVDAEELEDLYAAAQDVLNQFMIDNATWGIPLWEKSMSIISDDTKTDDERRGNIKSMVRRYGTSTIGMVKNLAESYLNGEVEIIEYMTNLIDLRSHTWTAGYISSTGSITTSSTTWVSDADKLTLNNQTSGSNGGVISDYIPIVPFKNLSLGANIRDITGIVGYVALSFYDINKVFISRVLSSQYSKVLQNIAPPVNAAFVRANVRVDTVGAGIEISPQVQYGPIATSYEPRKDYTLGVKFIGKRGNPSNMDDIKNAIRQVTPSHLDLIFTLTYLIWQEIEKANVTWNTADTYTWDAFETAFFS
jgi:hypothetical protein